MLLLFVIRCRREGSTSVCLHKLRWHLSHTHTQAQNTVTCKKKKNPITIMNLPGTLSFMFASERHYDFTKSDLGNIYNE